ncbi:serine O-acetyltransferase [Enterococcus casseliflavus]|uniref:serine O-acetyltransferase n=1 Tax=Enterococcus casseliflavus TaxID=37734 RepID=UPI0022E47D1D|nr:serine acetyltransferase [Enterococcus casseliflavus]
MKATKLLKKAIHLKGKNALLSHLLILVLRYIYSFDAYITEKTKVGENVVFKHNGLGCVLHPSAEIGDNCWIYQNVTIGANTRYKNNELDNTGAPKIGANTVVYSGAVIVGPINIGNDCVIGANCVITKDVPPFSIVSSSNMNVKPRKKDIEYITPKDFRVKYD